MRKKNKFIETIIFCLSLAWKTSKGFTVLRIITRLSVPLIAIIISFLSKSIIDIMTKDNKEINAASSIIYLVVFIVILNLVNIISNKISEYATTMQNDKIKKYIDLDMIKISSEADLELFDDDDYYDKFAIVQRDSQAISTILWSTLNMISNILAAIGVFIVLSNSSIIYALALGICIIPSVIANRWFTKAIYGLDISQIKGQRKESYLLHLATERKYSQEVRVYNMGELLKKKYEYVWCSLYFTKKKLIKSRSLIVGVFQLLPEIAIGVITIDIAMGVISGSGTIGEYTLYTGLLAQLWSGMLQAVTSAMEVYDNKMKMDSIHLLKSIPKKIKNTTDNVIEEIETIQFVNVDFIYPGTNKYVLKNINIKIEKQDRIAIVGVNGSGKSTLIKLLLRFYDPSAGEILVNGTNVKDYNLDSLRSCFNVYFQGSSNFGFSIKENIVLNDILEDKLIYEALESVEANNILSKASSGLDTYLTRMFDDKGIELSGGEQQKIALARALVRDKPIIVLDEPSSALDPEAESKIFQHLQDLSQNKTTIFTSHRLSNVFMADRIIVLEAGCIIEEGSKEELLANEQRFSELFKLQMSKFID